MYKIIKTTYGEQSRQLMVVDLQDHTDQFVGKELTEIAIFSSEDVARTVAVKWARAHSTHLRNASFKIVGPD